MDISVSMKQVRVMAGGVVILKNVTVDIPRGKIVGVLGPSGAGKTTLMRVIVGRQRLQAGSAKVLGLAAGSAALRGRIGYMPQSTSVYPDLTVRENVQYFGAMLGQNSQAVRTIIDAVELAPQARQLVRTLSGGQKSRVSLAIALLGKPDMLVLDEPTVGVDPVLRQQLWQLFHQIARTGTTLLVSSHVMDEAGRCDDLLLIREGELLAHGAPDALCRQTGSDTIEETFLKLVGAAV
jgi:ABC-2 type transport system ATP-binding protein